MTNKMIIIENSIRLAEAGILKHTGREFTFEDGEGKTRTIKEIETIHTYNGWKELGYQVQKGQKARCSFVIWKHVSSKKKDADGGEDDGAEKSGGKMIMKRAAFFTSEQVQKVSDAE